MKEQEITPCLLDPRKDCDCTNKAMFSEFLQKETHFRSISQATKVLRDKLVAMTEKQRAASITGTISTLFDSRTLENCDQFKNR